MKISRILILLTVIIGLLGCNSEKTINDVKNEILENSKNDSLVIKTDSLNFQTNQTSKDTIVIYQPTDLKSDSLFDKNAIGIVFLDSSNEDNYFLYIRFHSFIRPYSVEDFYRIRCGNDIPIEIPTQTIILFDEDGKLATIKAVNNCIMKCWCENDGGSHICPTFKLAINKKEFIRPAQIKNARLLYKMISFAVINFDSTKLESFYPETGKENENVVMRGRLSSDYEGYTSEKPAFKFYDRNVQITVDRETQIIADRDKTLNLEHCVFLETLETKNKRSEEIFCCGP